MDNLSSPWLFLLLFRLVLGLTGFLFIRKGLVLVNLGTLASLAGFFFVLLGSIILSFYCYQGLGGVSNGSDLTYLSLFFHHVGVLGLDFY